MSREQCIGHMHRAYAGSNAVRTSTQQTYATNRDPWLSYRDRLTVSDARARIRITHLDPS